MLYSPKASKIDILAKILYCFKSSKMQNKRIKSTKLHIKQRHALLPPGLLISGCSHEIPVPNVMTRLVVRLPIVEGGNCRQSYCPDVDLTQTHLEIQRTAYLNNSIWVFIVHCQKQVYIANTSYWEISTNHLMTSPFINNVVNFLSAKLYQSDHSTNKTDMFTCP